MDIQNINKAWVDYDNHTHPMVCFGKEDNHMVLGPDRAFRLGEKLAIVAQDLIDCAAECSRVLKKMEEEKAEKEEAGASQK